MPDDLFGYIDNSIYKKAASYCAYQERCQQEVRERLYKWNVKTDDAEKIIAKLISDNFINEQRFAIAYAGGKFRMKQWGKIKINMALKQKKVSSACIAGALNEIDARDYRNTMRELINEAQKKIIEKDPLKKNHRIAQSLISKGFEPEAVRSMLTED